MPFFTLDDRLLRSDSKLAKQNRFFSGVLSVSFRFLCVSPHEFRFQAQDQGPGTIRKEVNLVVLDATREEQRRSKSWTVLKKEDFAVREDGVRENNRAFQPRRITPQCCYRPGPERFDRSFPGAFARCGGDDACSTQNLKTRWRCSLFPPKPNCAEPLSKDKKQNCRGNQLVPGRRRDKYQ